MYPGQATFSGSTGTMNSGGLSNSGSVCSGISGSAAARQRIQLAPIAGTAQRDTRSQKQEIFGKTGLNLMQGTWNQQTWVV